MSSRLTTTPIARAGCLAVAGAALAAALVGTSSAATATATHSSARFAPIHAVVTGSGLHAKNIDGQNWSGYAVHGGAFQTTSAGWTEPQVSCNSRNDLFAPWVGIDGYGTRTVEQTGVATDCSSGSPQFAGWYEMYPAAPVYYSNPVSPGDHFSASVTRNGSQYTLRLTDKTKGWTKTVVKSLASAKHATAEVIMESPTGAYPNFHKVNFTNTRVNGSPIGSFGPDALDASNRSGFEDHTSALVNGLNFHIDYLRE